VFARAICNPGVSGFCGTSPLLNQAPNSGDPTFRTSFTSTGAYQITNLDNSGVIVGQALFAPSTFAALQTGI
jgi:hypothetical protein